MRNWFVTVICNFMINHVATEDYKRYLWTVYGMGTKAFDNEFWNRYTDEYNRRQEESEL